jgi:hypothetical protein
MSMNLNFFYFYKKKEMIQRFQSLFLLLAATACILLFFFPVAFFFNEAFGNYKFFITGVHCMDPDPKVQFSIWFVAPLFVLTAISSILSLVTIFLYRNRLLQLRLTAFNILFTILLVVLIFLFYAGKIQGYTQIAPSYQAGVFFPLFSLVCLVLANRWIRKDEALVKAADRLR